MDDIDKKRLISHSGIKGNVRYITITDNVPEHWEPLISITKSNYDWYAYIYHDKDSTDKHIHILAYDKGGTSLKAHCNRFSPVVPHNFVEKVFNPRAMARYLIHKDNPEKYSYDRNDIITNNLDKYASFLLDMSGDVKNEFQDYMLVVTGKMSIDDFLDKYRGEFCSMPFYQKIQTFHKLSQVVPVSRTSTHQVK